MSAVIFVVQLFTNDCARPVRPVPIMLVLCKLHAAKSKACCPCYHRLLQASCGNCRQSDCLVASPGQAAAHFKARVLLEALLQGMSVRVPIMLGGL